ncbi:MAG: Trm112 family protein [Thermomicrobiales bacterium]|jgi:uncharacterized protein YbaR (Trm112 family)|nr:Trm112 family protein [Thermomicrobiales bacterium]
MTESTTTLISQELLDLLVCPIDHANLEIAGDSLRCTRCGRVYPVQDGIPNMLVDAS